MRKNILFFSCLFFAISFFLPNITLAHKVRVFAYGEGNEIVGETAFSGGRKPKNADIIVTDAAGGKEVFSGQTDENGEFRFEIPQEAREGRMDLLIVVKAGDGHRGEWPLAAEDYLTGLEDLGTEETTQEETAQVDATAPAAEEEAGTLESTSESAQTANTGISLHQMEQLMGKVVDRKLAPVKHMLAQSEDHEPTLQDILGGIGYILGLAGVAAYFKAQQKSKGGAKEC